MDTERYTRKPFPVDAKQVAEDNIEQVSEWCGGVIKNVFESEEPIYILVPVRKPLNDRQTQAFLGDWVLKSESGFKVYTERAFENSFEKPQTSGNTFVQNVFEQQAPAAGPLESLQTISRPKPGPPRPNGRFDFPHVSEPRQSTNPGGTHSA